MAEIAAKTKPKPKKKPGIKNFLNSPYSLIWPNLDKGDNKTILDGIRSVFPPNGIKRGKAEVNSNDESQLISWDMVKQGLAIGVNSVTKSLEKDNLMLVLVCRSTKPSILTNHLMLLSATRSTPCCAIFGLSDVMAPLLKMKTVAACGFKKDITANILKDLVEYIVCKIPQLPEPYLALWNNNGHNNAQTTFTQKEISQSSDNKGDIYNSKLNKEDEATCVKRGKKRTFAVTYINSQIKTLPPRETPKLKKRKTLKKPK